MVTGADPYQFPPFYRSRSEFQNYSETPKRVLKGWKKSRIFPSEACPFTPLEDTYWFRKSVTIYPGSAPKKRQRKRCLHHLSSHHLSWIRAWATATETLLNKKVLRSRTMILHVHYNSLYISFPSSTNQQREMTNSALSEECELWRLIF